MASNKSFYFQLNKNQSLIRAVKWPVTLLRILVKYDVLFEWPFKEEEENEQVLPFDKLFKWRDTSYVLIGTVTIWHFCKRFAQN